MRLLLSTIMVLCLGSATGMAAYANESAQLPEETGQQEVSEGQANTVSANTPKEYFPKAGDFSVGFDSSPFLNYIGNMFNGTTNNSLNLGDNTLHFRYHITDNTAARLSVRVRAQKDMDKFYVDDQAAQSNDPLSRAQVEDMRVIYTHEYEVKAGYLMFRGENRLRGFVGGDLFFGYGREQGEFNYGNQMSEMNSSPETVVNWNNGNTANQNMRVLEYSSGSTINAGIGALVGAEYFLAPKVSLGAEMGLVYGHTFVSQANQKSETMVGSNHVEEDFELSPGLNEMAVFTTFPFTFGNLYLLISF